MGTNTESYSSQSTLNRYSKPAVFLHWTLTFLIVILVGLGWYMMDIEGQPGSEWYFNLHKSLGLIAFVLIALRTAWRLTHKPPTFATHQPTWQLVVSQFTHGLLYAAMILMPLTGFAAASLSEEGTAFFGIEIPRLVAQNPALSDQLFYIHELTAWVLVVFVAIHVLAALKHLVVNKDEVFGRMWF